MRGFKIVACSIIALMGAAGAVSAKGGKSANSPGAQMTTGTLPDARRDAKGASTYSPGAQIKGIDPAARGDARGASSSAPGKKK